MLLNEKVNDYDLYFTNKETVLAVTDYYVKQFNEENGQHLFVLDGEKVLNGEQDEYGSMNMDKDRVKIICESNGVCSAIGYLPQHEEGERVEIAEAEQQKYKPIYLSSNAITLTDQIQMVIRFYGDSSAIHENYDYVHCTNFWLSENKSINLNQPALESILSKQLIYVGSKYPLASVIRSRKFIKRGWEINAGQYLKMAFQISLLDLTNIETLEDQLIGVDVAYFGMLINALKSTGAIRIEYGYISEIINRIFN